MFKEFEANAAYAKIQGENDFLKFINKLVVYLGREVSLAEQNIEEEILFISDSHKISRKHLKIFWDENQGKWLAQNLSKNYVYVNNTVLKSTDIPYVISPMASIKIDECRFYFFQARPEEN